MLFNRGKDISQAPIKIGTNQLPKPPMAVGITKKKSSKKRVMLPKRYKVDNCHLKKRHQLD